jgi:hypothetical protein
MQINPATSVVTRGTETPVAKRPSQTKTDTAVFRAAESLNQSLLDTPDVRGDVVARARILAASVQYPPKELIDGLATLLAERTDQEN